MDLAVSSGGEEGSGEEQIQPPPSVSAPTGGDPVLGLHVLLFPLVVVVALEVLGASLTPKS